MQHLGTEVLHQISPVYWKSALNHTSTSIELDSPAIEACSDMNLVIQPFVQAAELWHSFKVVLI